MRGVPKGVPVSPRRLRAASGIAQITGYRFPRQARLLAAADFKQVFADPRRSGDAYFTVLATQGAAGSARLGLAISKKQIRRAVDRNRLKRLARDVFRLHQHEVAGLDLVVLARHRALAVDNAELRASLLRHFRRLARSATASRSS